MNNNAYVFCVVHGTQLFVYAMIAIERKKIGSERERNRYANKMKWVFLLCSFEIALKNRVKPQNENKTVRRRKPLDSMEVLISL